EGEVLECSDVLLELLDRAGAGQRRRHAPVAERPGERHLGERLTAPLRQLVQRTDLRQPLLRDLALGEIGAVRGTRALGDAVEVAVAEQALRERREDDDAEAVALAGVEHAL